MSVIIDRRLNDRNKSAVNRERFIRRYKAQIQRAVSDMVAERSIKDMERGGDVKIPVKDISEPSFRHGDGGDREIVHPGQPRVHPGRPHPASRGRRRRRRQRQRRRRRRRRGRLRVHTVARRVHADLLRRSRAAEARAHHARRDPPAQAAARWLHAERLADQPERAALAAQRARPAHRAGAARGARRPARTGTRELDGGPWPTMARRARTGAIDAEAPTRGLR